MKHKSIAILILCAYWMSERRFQTRARLAEHEHSRE